MQEPPIEQLTIELPRPRTETLVELYLSSDDDEQWFRDLIWEILERRADEDPVREQLLEW